MFDKIYTEKKIFFFSPQEVAALVLLKASGPNHISTMYYIIYVLYTYIKIKCNTS